MIIYGGGPLGLHILLRLHGSAVVRALTPSLLSTLFLWIPWERSDFGDPSERLIGHPYAIGALVAAFSFIVVFRANHAYQRYWEAADAIHHMHSKWMDCAMQLAAFHYQAVMYDKSRPPAFGAHPELNNLVVERNRENEWSPDELKDNLNYVARGNSLRKRGFLVWGESRRHLDVSGNSSMPILPSDGSASAPHYGGLENQTRMSVSSLYGGLRTAEPSLFLQETAHLLSLLSAVAFSTLRADVEGIEIPLVEYKPGSAWPPVDPDKLSSDTRAAYDDKNACIRINQFLFGVSRSQVRRSMYNAARPLRVLGGVSDAEALLLQNARGPFAKVALCTMWLQEFMTRESMTGSVGNVAPPILSRLYQVVSDGMIGYNKARKIAYVPFPFPHAQLSLLFTGVLVFFMPILMFSFVNTRHLATIMNFFTVLCFTALHEVARELENPFVNVPNDLPLNNFQAQFNEGLLTMFNGFHPDCFWDVSVPGADKKNDDKKNVRSSSKLRASVCIDSVANLV